MKTATMVKVLAVLTVTFLAVSLTFLVYQWYLINGLSITIFVFPVTVVKVNPLGVVFFEQPLYVVSFTTKLVLGLLFLVPYTLAILVMGPICIFILSPSGVSGYTKFRDAVNNFQSIIKGTRKQKILLASGILTILALYTFTVVSLVINSKIILLEPIPILLILFLNGFLGLNIAGTLLQNSYKTS